RASNATEQARAPTSSSATIGRDRRRTARAAPWRAPARREAAAARAAWGWQAPRAAPTIRHLRTYERPIVRRLAALLIMLAAAAAEPAHAQAERRGPDPDAEPRPVDERGPLTADELTTIDIFERASPSVVFIATV